MKKRRSRRWTPPPRLRDPARYMLFNSYLFLLLFLPIALAGHYLAGAISLRLAAFWLCLTSFVFYGWWNPQFVALLALSIAFNYVVSLLILRFAGRARLQGLDRKSTRLNSSHSQIS